MINPSRFRWPIPVTRSDGSVYDAVQHGHYELQVDSGPAWRCSSPYQRAISPGYAGIAATELPEQDEGDHVLRWRAVDASGKAGAWSPTLTFTIRKSAPATGVAPEAL